MSKWNKNITAKCKQCNEIENSKHLIFDYVNVVKIRKAASECLNFDINWKLLFWGSTWKKHRSPNYIIIFCHLLHIEYTNVKCIVDLKIYPNQFY